MTSKPAYEMRPNAMVVEVKDVEEMKRRMEEMDREITGLRRSFWEARSAALEEAALTAEKSTYISYMHWDPEGKDPCETPVHRREEIAKSIRSLKRREGHFLGSVDMSGFKVRSIGRRYMDGRGE